MQQKSTIKIELIPYGMKKITAVLQGNHEAYCLFIDIWEIYEHTFSGKIKLFLRLSN